MYKIQFLFVLLLLGSGVTYAQQPGQRRTSLPHQRLKTSALSRLLIDPINTTQSHRPTVFTAHQLANRVDFSRKHESDTLTGGQ